MSAEKAYHNFSWELAANYLQDTNVNTCISPPGIFLLLSAIAVAADNKTKWELDKVLCGKANPRDNQGQAHIAQIRWLNDAILSCPVIKNQTTVQIPAEYGLLPKYKSDVEIAFRGGLKIARSEDENLILENLITFRDLWRERFLETERVFHTTPYVAPKPTGLCDRFGYPTYKSVESEQEHSYRIPFIYREDMSLTYCDSKDFISVAIPFKNDCHMVLAMPKDRELSSCLGDADFLKKALTLYPHHNLPVDLYLPSFTLKTGLSLESTLRRMGVTEIFDEDISKIYRMTRHRMHVRSAMQDVEVEVNAEGAFAETRTKFVLAKAIIGMGAPLPPKKVIRLDHPFLFAIWRSTPTPIPLFIGTFQKPK